MKYWQLSVCLLHEKEIHKKYLGNIDLLVYGRNEVSDEIIRESFAKSKIQYYIISNNTLRVNINDSLESIGLEILETITILQAFERFGGDAITEVFDYGSYDLDFIVPKITKIIIIKKESNKEIFLLHILSIFRDKNIITSLDEFPDYTKAYQEKGEIMIKSTSEKIEIVIKELDYENIKYELY